jgi:DNA-binding response OmpR family regulator
VRFGNALIVEDELLEAAATEMALLRLFERVVVVASLAAAGERLKTDRFDLAVIDLNLSDGSGMDLIRALWAHNGDVAIVAVSTRADDETLVKAAFDGADLVLRQPLPIGELQAGVWQLYREGVLAALDQPGSAHEAAAA